MIPYNRLREIVPSDQALAAKAVSVSLQQISGISRLRLSDLAQAVTPQETTRNLPEITALTTAVPASVANYFTSTLATGTGPNGTILVVDILGTAAGYVSAGAMANTVSNLASVNVTALTSTYTTMANVVNGVYGDPTVGPVIIPSGPYANTYVDADEAFANALIPGAQSEITTVISGYPTYTANLNANWTNMANQLVLEQTTQTSADIIFANLVPNSTTSMYAFIFGLPAAGQQTENGGQVQMIESVTDTSTFTGQAVIASLRQGKNQPFLQAVGIETNNDVPSDPNPLPPTANLIPSTYTAAEAAALVIR